MKKRRGFYPSCIYLLIAIISFFLGYALNITPFAFPPLQLKGTTTKPSYCRNDLPGCVPQEIRYVFFLHIPKTGGTSASNFLQQSSPRGFAGKRCDIAKFFGKQFCYGGHSPAIGLRQQSSLYDVTRLLDACDDLKLSFAKWKAANIFDQQDCNLIYEGHFDFAMLDTLPRDVFEHTLIIVAFRHPFKRVISSFHHLRMMSPGHIKMFDDLGLFNFVKDGFEAEDTVNRMTKTLAGQYCCYGDDRPIDAEELWSTAKLNFDLVGSIIMTEQMDESLSYLGHVLGWSDINSSIHLRQNPYKWQEDDVDQSVNRALQRSNNLDSKLYDLAQDRFSEQLNALSLL